ncbi:hypothetical protein BS50DRAFT_509403 [Corynespora cassiicola Philippines]|uniref:Uncharacterized protein n=1 Tax=Corynespora cassiicola Philippines TaxID=1448308 RepID=A0A2T2N0T8_CORCC|nr:hypothetical protein BS50DRAFT_509403 [Corynespora cassiicola Philippines]
MCCYTYSWYYCNHNYYIHGDSIEICENHSLPIYSYDAWNMDLCNSTQVTCAGFSDCYCPDCSEDIILEFDLDEM